MQILKNPRYILLLILLLTIFSILVDLPRLDLKYEYNFSEKSWAKYIPSWVNKDKTIKIDNEVGGYDLSLFKGLYRRDLDIKKGLDISGGTSVLLEADMSSISDADKNEALDSLKNVIERRVNLLGISEANVQTTKSGDKYRILVELAGMDNPSQAISTIGQVAQLKFKTEGDTPAIDPSAEPEEQQITVDPETGEAVIDPSMLNQQPVFNDTELTGANLRKSTVTFDPTTKEPQIQLQFNSDGTKLFREITTKSMGKRVAIYLDDILLIAPTVNAPITDGLAVITGGFTVEQAKLVSAQLNGGALPVPVKVIEQRNIGATLGQESVNQSVYAAFIGLGLVIGFMVFYYGRLGVLASLALIVYGLVTLAIYKIVPIVLTLPGLTGFILSIGMAVDANILIFERIKEEIRMGKPVPIAMENGFGRSWDSIRDANVTTLVTAFILFNPFDWSFLPTFGLVRGFAVTLALGIAISLFTGIFVTRNLVRVFYK
jgi:preprotein translocase subunit SecD